MASKSIWLFLILGMALAAQGVGAAELESRVSLYGKENGEGYLQPLADALGSNLNAGLFRTAYVPVDGFHFYIGIAGMAAPISDDSKTFMARTEDPFTPPAEVEAPTIVGSGDAPSVTGAGGTVFHFAPGFNMNFFPSGIPQLTIGSLMGTEGTLRYAESDLDDNVGRLKLFSLGARHNVGQYFSNLPVDLSAGVWWQSFTLGDLIDASTFYVGGQASYATGMLTFYGGLGLENVSLEISYLQATNETDTEKVTFDMTSDNSLRLTAGAALSLSVFHLHADYNLASQSTFCVGFGIGSY